MVSNHLHTRPKVIYPGDKSKPKFLLQLLHFINRELKLLNAEKAVLGDPRRLQVMREAFSCFILEFKTYSSILTEIKNEYETTFLNQRETIEKLIPFKSKYSILEFESRQEIDSINISNTESIRIKNEEAVLKQDYISELLETISKLKKRNQDIEQELLKSESLNTRERHLNVKLDELQGQYTLLEDKFSAELAQKDISISQLTDELKTAIKNIDYHSREVYKLKTTLLEMVPKVDYMLVTDTLQEYKNKNTILENSNIDLKSESRILNDSIKQKQNRVKQLELDRFPDWESIQKHTPQSVSEYSIKCKGLEYNESILVLIREIGKAKAAIKLDIPFEQVVQKPTSNSTKQSATKQSITKQVVKTDAYFVGLGTSPQIPKVLRSKGKILNQRLTRYETYQIIKDVWDQKTEKLNLVDFLYIYLKKRFGNHDIVIEFGYNIYESCRRYSTQSTECLIFFNILSNVYNDSVYHYVSEQLLNLENEFKNQDCLIHGIHTGFIPKPIAFKVLSMLNKTNEQSSQLKNSIDLDFPGDQVSIKWLFEGNNDSILVDTFKEQIIEEMEIYISGLRVALDTFSREEEILKSDFARCLQRYDVKKNEKDCIKYVLFGLGLSKAEDIKPRELFSKRLFIENLRRHVVHKG